MAKNFIEFDTCGLQPYQLQYLEVMKSDEQAELSNDDQAISYELTDKGLLELYVEHKIREDRYLKLYQLATSKNAHVQAEKHLIKMKKYEVEAKVLEAKILNKMKALIGFA